MAIQIRCDGDLYGVISDDHTSIEVKCKRRGCGYKPGVVVLHTMSLATGQVIQTKKFRDPLFRKEDHAHR